MARTRRITAENLTPAGLSSWNGCEAGFKRSGASFSPVLPFPPVMAASRKLIGLFLGVIYLQTTPKQYTSFASVLIDEGLNKVVDDISAASQTMPRSRSMSSP